MVFFTVGDVPLRFAALLVREAPERNGASGAHNSAVECHLHTVEVVGSNPAVPTIQLNNLAVMPGETWCH